MERAVTYVRVSTEEEKQLNALAKQREEAKEAIAKQGWTFVREYVDEGVSGTETRKRAAYNKLYNDMASNDFDIVVIKSQDRLMRNPKDWYLFLSRLLENGKRLYIYMDNAFYSSQDSLITGIKAILAEEYSRELSRKINLAARYRQERGSSIITCGRMLGYIQKDGELYIHEEEAKVVERMAQLYEQGLGARAVKNKLDEEGWVNRFGRPISKTTVQRFPHNYAYEGTIVQNRQHKDFDTKRTTTNDESEWIIHKNRCPAIISHERMEKIRGFVKERSCIPDGFKIARGANRGHYALSSKIVCGICGKHYRRSAVRRNGVLTPCWICGTYQEQGRRNPKGRPAKQTGCDGVNLFEDFIYEAIQKIADEQTTDMAAIAKKAIETLKRDFKGEDKQRELESIQQSIKAVEDTQRVLLDKLLEGVITNDVYGNKNSELQAKKDKLQADANKIKSLMKKMERTEEEYADIFRRLTSPVMEGAIKFKTVLRNISRIVVFDDHMDIELGFGERYTVNYADVSNTGQYGIHTELLYSLKTMRCANKPYEVRLYIVG